MSPEHVPSMGGKTAVGFVVLLLVVRSATSILIAHADPLWLDELHTAWTTNGDWGQVSQRAIAGNQSPLYFWLVAVIRLLDAGFFQSADTVVMLRLISILSGGLVLGFASLLVWRATRSIVAIACTGVLILIEPTLLFYSTEARPYALMQAMGVIQAITFLGWLNRWDLMEPLSFKEDVVPSSRKFFYLSDWGFALSSAILVNIHLTSIGLLLAEALFFSGLVVYRQLHAEVKPAWHHLFRSAAMITVLILILTIPVWPAVGQVVNRAENWSSVSNSESLLREAKSEIGWGFGLPIVVCLFWSLSDFRKGKVRKHNSLKSQDPNTMAFQWKALTMFVFLWGVIPSGILVMLETFQGLPFAARRYALIGTIAFPIFGGLCVGALSPKWIRNGSLILILVANLLHQPWVFHSINDGKFPQLRDEDWFSVISEINQNEARSKAPIFLFANLLEDRQAFENQDTEFQDYLGFPLKGDPKVKLTERALICFPTLIPNSVRRSHLKIARKSKGAWLIIRGDETLVKEILSEIRSNAGSQSSISIESATFSQSPWSVVRLFWIGF